MAELTIVAVIVTEPSTKTSRDVRFHYFLSEWIGAGSCLESSLPGSQKYNRALTFGARTVIQMRYQQDTGEGTIPSKRIPLQPPMSECLALHKFLRTWVVGHVNQESRNSGCMKLINCSLNIDLELREISIERANKHLPKA
jgi:hypothetical protein